MRAEVKLITVAAGVCLLAGAPALAQDEIDACGELVAGVECVLFETDGGALYVLDELEEFVVGDRVHVIGEIDPDCISVCQEGDGCVTVASITYCDGAVAICGRLVDGVTCTLLEDDKGFLFAVEELEDFDVGERVHVRGTLDADCVSICQQIDGCIRDNTIRAERDGDCATNGDDGPPVCEVSSLLMMTLTFAGLIHVRRRRPA